MSFGLKTYKYTCLTCNHEWLEDRVPKFAEARCEYKCDNPDCSAKGFDNFNFVQEERVRENIYEPKGPYIPSDKVLVPSDYKKQVYDRIKKYAPNNKMHKEY